MSLDPLEHAVEPLEGGGLLASRLRRMEGGLVIASRPSGYAGNLSDAAHEFAVRSVRRPIAARLHM
jgi:hypothetical protein